MGKVRSDLVVNK